MFQLVFEKRALEDLNKLDRQIKERIWNKLQNCKEEPFRFLEPLTEIKGFKLRIGDYRVIIDVDFKENKLTVIKVGHRKNVYEK
ncbi:type II toxin-antitoxin system RelE/ParE family toxin [Candidatus Woesearchaeota archaeon]|nr:type II toxin-antitoxin system RelE/ParE family toxin [Candidatus Woesearchaeota archaeon]